MNPDDTPQSRNPLGPNDPAAAAEPRRKPPGGRRWCGPTGTNGTAPTTPKLHGDYYGRKATLRKRAKDALLTMQHTVAPALVARAASDIPKDDLTTAERLTRDIRGDLLSALGPSPSAGQVELVNLATAQILIVQSVGTFIMQMCDDDAVVDRHRKRVYPVVLDFLKISQRAQSVLKLLHLHEQGKAQPVPLDTYISQWRQAEAKVVKARGAKVPGVNRLGWGGVPDPTPQIFDSENRPDPINSKNIPNNSSEPIDPNNSSNLNPLIKKPGTPRIGRPRANLSNQSATGVPDSDPNQKTGADDQPNPPQP